MKKYILFIVVMLVALIVVESPYTFARDGLLTKKKVNEFDSQFSFSTAKRHNQEIRDLYLISFSNEEIVVQEESMGKIAKDNIEVKKIAPFLYKWKRTSDSTGIFRVTIGKQKYYFLFVVT